MVLLHILKIQNVISLVSDQYKSLLSVIYVLRVVH